LKAVVQDRYGGPETLELREVPLPTPDETSVLVQVVAASVNALDWRFMRGKPWVGRLFGFGLLRPKRKVRGVDIAGRVTQVRKKDSRFRLGDEVFGLGSGAFAEYAAADESEITAKPAGVPFLPAATLGVAAVTALQGLRDHGHVKPGQKVLITGAGSGVGTFAVQLARWLGGTVTAVTNPRSVEAVRSLGPDLVLDYTKDEFLSRPERYDLVLDVSGKESIRRLTKLLVPGGVFVGVGVHGGFGRLVAAGLLRGLFRYPIRTFYAKVNPKDLRTLGELVASGQVHPVIDRKYPLSEVPNAMEYVDRHLVVGKVVIDVAPAGAT
jgi:NADPH:quinone reductase-like Zn-dependent oxidoreductase